MTVADLPKPRAISLEWITPSLANDLLDCPYRVAWQLDPTYRALHRPNTYSELGVIAHGVIEDAAHGMFVGEAGAIRSVIEQRWDERAKRAEEDLSRAWEPATIPSREEWPGYHLTKVRITRQAASRSVRLERPSPAVTASAVESPLTDDDAMLRGRPDRVEGPHDARRIVDVKSGLHQTSPSPPQLRQLMLYGHLVETTTDDHVAEIVIEDASGKRWTQGFDREATTSLVAQVRQELESFNAATRDGSIATHATPSADGCRWCSFRVVCSSYWSELDTTWGHGSVLGVVRRAQLAAAGSVLELEVSHPSDAAGSPWVISGAPTELATPGREVAIADGELTGIEHHLRWRWSTLVWPQLEGASQHKT